MQLTPNFYYLPVTPPEAAEAHRLAYCLWGNSDAANGNLLCVHGLTRNGRDFDYLARELSSYYQVICPDMAGRGKSDWLSNTQNYNYDTYTKDIFSLLDSRKVTQVDWVGTSMGGILGMRVAAERPDLVRKLVLNDIGAVIPLTGLQRINKYAGLNMLFQDKESATNYLKNHFSPFGIQDDSHWQHMLEHSFTLLSNGEYQLAYDPGILDPLRDQAKNLTLAADTLLWPWWDAIKCPVLIIRGESSDILLADTVTEMLERNSNASAVTLPNIGHAPSLMEAGQIELVKNWLLS